MRAITLLLLAALLAPCLAESDAVYVGLVPCPECGTQVTTTANVCSGCGVVLDAEGYEQHQLELEAFRIEQEAARVAAHEAAMRDKRYSPLQAGFLNIIPSVGFFYVEEPGLGVAQLGLFGLGTVLAVTNFSVFGPTPPAFTMGIILAGGAYIGGLFIAPALADAKNKRLDEQAETEALSLSLDPGLRLSPDGSLTPTLSLTFSF